MKLVFCGTPAFAVPVLQAVIAAEHTIALVVTQPDRAAGRGLETHVSPVKQAAMKHGIPVVQPEKIKNNLELRAQLEEIAPDAILVVAYGRIIPQWMLDQPRLGNINLHGSLLPKYRGAAPIQWAVANGEQVTGVTTMLLEAGLDTGPMLLAKAVPIGEEETSVDLFESLSAIGAELMVETLAGLENGAITPQVQDHSLATLAPILTREDGLISFARTAKENHARWRGFQPWPGAHTTLRGKKLIVHRMAVVASEASVSLLQPTSTLSSFAEGGGSASVFPPDLAHLPESDAITSGELLVHDDHLFAGCAQNSTLELLEVQIEGKRRMSAAEFLHGYQVRSGERLGG